MENESGSVKRIADSYFELQAVMGVTKHMGGIKATDELAHLCHIDEDKFVLDIGSGLGRTSCYLAKKYGCKVVGIDLSERMVEESKKRARKEGLDKKVEFIVGDVLKLPFEDACFDAVIGESVLAFVEDKSGAINECIRVTKPQGYVGYNECTWITNPPDKLVRYIGDVLGAEFLSPEGWEKIWVESGLEEVSAESYKVRVMEQWGYEMRELSFKEYFGAWYRFLKLLRRSPESRKWAKKTLSMPSNIFAIFKYFGYGIYVGRK